MILLSNANQGSNLVLLLPVALVVIFIFSSSRRMKKEKSQRAQLINSIQVGDEVITIGGFQGKVKKVGKEDCPTIDLELCSGCVVLFQKEAIRSNLSQDKRTSEIEAQVKAQIAKEKEDKSKASKKDNSKGLK